MTEMKPVAAAIADIERTFEMPKVKREIASCAPKQLTTERIIAMAMAAVRDEPKLAQCTHGSLVGCLIKATKLGLEIDKEGQKAILIPYGPTCKLIIGFRGYMELARRSPDVQDILTPQVVYDRDEFVWEEGSDPKLIHKPCLDGERGEITHFYVVHISSSGRPIHTVMTKMEVDKRKRVATSNPRYPKDGPWHSWYEPMGQKTVIRSHAKYMPSARDLDTAVALDEAAELGKDQAIDFLETTFPQEPPTKKTLADLTPPVDEPNKEQVEAPEEPQPVNEPPEEAQAEIDAELIASYRNSILEACNQLGKDAAKTLKPLGLSSRTAVSKCDDLDQLKLALAAAHQAVDQLDKKEEAPPRPDLKENANRAKNLFIKLQMPNRERVMSDAGLEPHSASIDSIDDPELLDALIGLLEQALDDQRAAAQDAK